MYVWHIYTTYHILLIAIKLKGTDFLTTDMIDFGFDFSFRNYHAYLASVRGWEYFENKTHCKVTY